MSECIDAPEWDRRETSPRKVQFTLHNPEALFRPEVARAVVSLLLSPNRHPQVTWPASIPDQKEGHS
jgi:hypothetical protein